MKGMRRLHRVYCRSSKFVKRNSTTIMTICGCVGFIATIIFAVQATPKARELMNEAEMKKGDELTKVEIVTVAAPAYSKAAVAGISTVTLVLGANFLSRKQKASMIGAYTALQKLYNGHRDKVGELFGADANDIIDREIIRDKKEEYKTDELGEKEFWFYIPDFDVRFKSTEKQVILGEYHFNRNYILRGYVPTSIMECVIGTLNEFRKLFLETKYKRYWWQMIQLLPSSYNQKRTICLNYEVLHHIYQDRRNHKLDEWHVVCVWIESLPYSEIITQKVVGIG